MSEIITPIGMLMFPHLFEPQAPLNGTGDPRYQCVLLFKPSVQKTQAFEKLKDAVSAEAKEFFKGKVPSGARNPLIKVGETEYPEKYAGFEDGDIMIRPWSKFAPGLVDARQEDITIQSDVWAGQLWRAAVVPFGYNTQGNKGVGLMLNHMQQAKADMPRMDGRKAASETFGALETDDDDREMASADADDDGGFF